MPTAASKLQKRAVSTVILAAAVVAARYGVGWALPETAGPMRRALPSGLALGVVAAPDGTRPVAVPAMWVPNKLAMAFTGGLWLPERRRPIEAPVAGAAAGVRYRCAPSIYCTALYSASGVSAY